MISFLFFQWHCYMTGHNWTLSIFSWDSAQLKSRRTFELKGFLFRWFPPGFRILCRWPVYSSTTRSSCFSSQRQEGVLFLCPPFRSPKRLLALGKWELLNPGITRWQSIVRYEHVAPHVGEVHSWVGEAAWDISPLHLTIYNTLSFYKHYCSRYS